MNKIRNPNIEIRNGFIWEFLIFDRSNFGFRALILSSTHPPVCISVLHGA